MGHNRLGNLPKTPGWKKVMVLLYRGADVADIANAALTAIESGLRQVPADVSFTLTLANIFRFVECARSKDFERALQDSGFDLPASPSLFDVLSGLKEKIDHDLLAVSRRTDLSELAQNSFTETLTKYVAEQTPSLFVATSDHVQSVIEQSLKGERFKSLMHEFYSVFTRRYLTYYLSRELPRHVGPGLRFENINEHQEFGKAFDLFVRQNVRIADEFTPGWFSKAQWKGNLSHESVASYAHVAFKKIASEFRRGGDVRE